jgi:hypothetical protein
MVFLICSFVAVAVLYGIERRYFAEQLVLFAALFWLFVFQCTVLFFVDFLYRRELDQALPDWINFIVDGLALFAYLTIALTPIVAVAIAFALGTLLAIITVSRRLKKISN